MFSIGYWNQIYPNWQVTNYSFILDVRLSSFTYCYQLVTVLKLEWPKVIPLSDTYCSAKWHLKILETDCIRGKIPSEVKNKTTPKRQTKQTTCFHHFKWCEWIRNKTIRQRTVSRIKCWMSLIWVLIAWLVTNNYYFSTYLLWSNDWKLVE